MEQGAQVGAVDSFQFGEFTIWIMRVVSTSGKETWVVQVPIDRGRFLGVEAEDRSRSIFEAGRLLAEWKEKRRGKGT